MDSDSDIHIHSEVLFKVIAAVWRSLVGKGVDAWAPEARKRAGEVTCAQGNRQHQVASNHPKQATAGRNAEYRAKVHK